MSRVIRLVSKPRRGLFARAGERYAQLLVALLVIIAGCLVLTIAISLLGI